MSVLQKLLLVHTSSLFFVFVWSWVFVTCHELGHVFIAKLLGIPVARFEIGAGRMLFSIRRRGFPRIIYRGVWSHLQGAISVPTEKLRNLPKLKQMLLTVGGLLGEVTLTLVVYLVYRGLYPEANNVSHPVMESFMSSFLTMHVLFSLATFLPLSADGQQLWALLTTSQKDNDETLAQVCSLLCDKALLIKVSRETSYSLFLADCKKVEPEGMPGMFRLTLNGRSVPESILVKDVEVTGSFLTGCSLNDDVTFHIGPNPMATPLQY